MHCANGFTPWQTRISFFPQEPLPRAPILFLGTIHRDERASPYLEKALLASQPNLITVEISPYSWRLRLKKEKEWLSRFRSLILEKGFSLKRCPSLRFFYLTLKMPYEWKVSQKVAKRLGLPVVAIDSSKIARKYLLELESSLSPEGIEQIAHSVVQKLEKEIFLARFYLKEGLALPFDEEDAKREIFMARKIKRFLSLKRPLSHVCGWRHLPGFLELFPEARGVLITPFDS